MTATRSRTVGCRALPLFVGVAVLLATGCASTSNTRAQQRALVAPEWKVGDEWAYRWEEPTGGGTYVASVVRKETLDGVEHFVVKSGVERETYHRASDLATSMEKVSGGIDTRLVPPRTNYQWPLAVGKTWELTFRQERPMARETSDLVWVWHVEKEETVSVPAGTFNTLKIVCRDKRTNKPIYEAWHSPDVKQFVRVREYLQPGTRERELIAFKLR